MIELGGLALILIGAMTLFYLDQRTRRIEKHQK
jgi:hypothetical protein